MNGDAGGYDTISDLGCSKNILTIGAVYPNGGFTSPTNVIWAGFSSCGPTDDGRIKPDVVAAGVAIITTDSANDYAYQSISGTSFAAPSVAGSANLLGQYYRQLHTNSADLLSSTIKGLVIHTADAATTNAGPSYRFGWHHAVLPAANGSMKQPEIISTWVRGASLALMLAAMQNAIYPQGIIYVVPQQPITYGPVPLS